MATCALPGGCLAACSADMLLELSIGQQTQMFLAALLLGAALGVVYDVFRVSRLALCSGWLVILLEDLAFFALAAMALFRFFLELSLGQMRFFALVGVVLGWLLYYFTLGTLVMGISREIIAFLQRFFALLWRMLTIPLKGLWAFVKKCGEKLTKPLVSQKNRLKYWGNMLYNKHVRNRIPSKPKRGETPWRKSSRKKKKRAPPWTPSSRS